MNQTSALIMLCTFVLVTSSYAGAQTNAAQSQPEIAVSVRPSIAIVIGIFSITFSLTFLLLVYVKFCSHSASDIFGHDSGNPQTDARRSSGINQSVIQSLPFFRFASLKGSKDGLECSVCLSKFEDEDTLRLLPKCGHGFHIDCVDRWFENHSSCPLCRCEVKAEDVAVFNYSNSSRFLIRDSYFVVENEFELFVERELDNDGERRRGRSRKKVESLLPETGSERQLMHKVKHKIVVPDVVFRNRWSDLNSSDLTSLNSDMLNVMSSQRFSVWSPENDVLSTVKLEMERSESRMTNKSIDVAAPSTSTSGNPNPVVPTPSISSETRSFSEITVLSRSGGPRHTITDDGGTDENLRRVWLPIARRTLRSFARRGKRPESYITPDQPRITIKVET